MKPEEDKKYKEYIDGLPKKRMGSGAIIRNARKEILMLKTGYKSILEIPGGVVEKDESPYEACRREIQEELGVTLKIEKILCVDYNKSQGILTESLMFIFYGGDLKDSEIQNIKVDGKEIIDYCFLPLESIKNQTTNSLYRRVSMSVKAIDLEQSYYLENQSLVS